MVLDVSHPRVLLAGFMGCGKSVTGIRLAARLSIDFVDLDERISRLAGASIEQIFSERGEHAFRVLETEALRSLPSQVVCALGGGALIQPENRDWALKESWMIYLRVGVQELVRRLVKDPTVRPLLQDDESTPLCSRQMTIRVRHLLQEREPMYLQAHQTLDVGGITPAAAAEKCWKAYARRNVLR